MLTITLNLPEKVEQQLEKDLRHLEEITGKPREFHLKKAFCRYLEEANEMVKYYEEERKKGSPNHTERDLLEHLNLKEID